MPFIKITEEISTEVDEEDYMYLILMCNGWHINKTRGYITGHIEGKTQKMHKIIARRMGLNGQIDHVDRNKYNNKRSNLREASNSQNHVNTNLRTDNTSGYKGVWKHRKKWKAQITINGERIHLGTFDLPEQAHLAYREAGEKYFGEFFNSGE